MPFAQRIRLAEETMVDGRVFPLTLAPAAHGSTSSDGKSAAELVGWVRSHRETVLQQALSHGAVLLRGWNVRRPEEFAEIGEALGLEKFPYIGGAAPRTNVVRDVVFTTNESPPECPIPFHHEMAQCPTPPAYVLFYCETPSAAGGETPLISSSEVARYFRVKHADFYARVKEHGVRYVRVMPSEDDNDSPIGRSWKSTFNATTREEAEAAMRAIGTEFEWLENGDCRTTTAVVSAVKTNPQNGREMFFNSMVAAYTGWVDSRNDPTKAVVLGNGEPVDGEALLDIQRYQMAHRVAFPWQAGDVLVIDNFVAMHSRNPFEPPRRILAFLGGPRVGRKVSGPVKQLGGAVVPAHTLRSGDQMPVVGTGWWKVPKDVCADTVVAAIEAGYRHLDCACDYGNEKEVGDGIRRAIEARLVTREELWVTSKLWNTYHAAEHVEPALRKTLADFGLDYVDLYLIHFPIPLRFVPFEDRYPPEWIFDPSAAEPRMEYSGVSVAETWGAMEQLADAGLARNIGVANWDTSGLRDLLTYARIPPAVNQVELHPYLVQPQLAKFCAAEGIAVTGFSPLGSSSYVEIGMAQKTDAVIDEALVKAVAAKHGKTPAQVVLRWAIQLGRSVIPKSCKVHRLKENIDLFDFALSEEDVTAISSLDKYKRFNDPGVFTQFMNSYAPIHD